MSKDKPNVSSDISQPHKQKNSTAVVLITGVVALTIGSTGGFFVGKVVSENNDQVGAMRGQNGSGVGRGVFSNRMAGGFGTVSAVSSDSLTIKSLRSESDTVYVITSSTTVTNDGEAANVSDIKVGDRVMVQTDESSEDATAKTAASIQINPMMNRPGNR